MPSTDLCQTLSLTHRPRDTPPQNQQSRVLGLGITDLSQILYSPREQSEAQSWRNRQSHIRVSGEIRHPEHFPPKSPFRKGQSSAPRPEACPADPLRRDSPTGGEATGPVRVWEPERRVPALSAGVCPAPAPGFSEPNTPQMALTYKNKTQSEAPRQGQGHFPRLLKGTRRFSKDSPAWDFHGLESREANPQRQRVAHSGLPVSTWPTPHPRPPASRPRHRAKVKAKVRQSSKELCQQKPHEIPSPTHLCRRQ